MIDYHELAEQLLEYVETSNDELGEFVRMLLHIRNECGYALLPEFGKIVDSELQAQLKNFKENSVIVKKDVPISYVEHRVYLKWKKPTPIDDEVCPNCGCESLVIGPDGLMCVGCEQVVSQYKHD